MENNNIVVKEGIYDATKATTWAKDIPPIRHQATISNPIPFKNRLTEAYASKHRLSEDNGSRPASISERPKKRLKPRLIARHTIDLQTVRSSATPRLAPPHSPLFFSHTPRQRPLLPPGLSSSSAAEMLNKGREETGGVTTLKLARGSVNTASPPRSTATSLVRSPEPKGRSPGMQILGSVGITELLEQDERPTFIIDVANPINFTPGGPLVIVFANASLRGHDMILDMVASGGKTDSPGMVTDFPDFKAWALSFVKNNESMDVCLPSISYGGINWSCSTLRKRLRLFSGSGSVIASGAGGSTGSNAAPLDSPMFHDRNKGPVISHSPLAQSVEDLDYFGEIPPPPLENTPPPRNASSPMSLGNLSPPRHAMIAAQSTALTSDMLITKYPDNPSFDWTRLPLSAALPKHIQFARSIDWASTPLGPIEDWAFDLRAMCNLIMGSPHPAAMYWGDEYIAIYNEAYIMLAGKKHPELMVSAQFFTSHSLGIRRSTSN